MSQSPVEHPHKFKAVKVVKIGDPHYYFFFHHDGTLTPGEIETITISFIDNFPNPDPNPIVLYNARNNIKYITPNYIQAESTHEDITIEQLSASINVTFEFQHSSQASSASFDLQDVPVDIVIFRQ